MFCSRLTEEAARGSFPPEVVKNIFSNVSSIYVFHSQFLLPDLEKCISHWWVVVSRTTRKHDRVRLKSWADQTRDTFLFFAKSRSERPGLGNVLLQHAPFLRMYAYYVRNFDQSMELVRTWTVRSATFRSVIQDIQV